MRRFLPAFGLFISFFFAPRLIIAQTGAVGDPFTSLNQAYTAPSAGIYYFNLAGTSFNTYIDAGKYVLVAIDFDSQSGNLPQGSSLSLATRGIMSPTVLATLTQTAEIRISTSTTTTDVSTTDATLVSRVVNDITLGMGVADNAINDSWTGTNAAAFTSDAGCATGDGTTLEVNIFHACGNFNGFHWIPSGGVQTEIYGNGETGSTVFYLWVKASSALPITLSAFTATAASNTVQLNWQTAAEINNKYFAVESSADGSNWQQIATVPGSVNSSTVKSYQFIDKRGISGTVYYRLKQVDLDGKFSYSAIKTVFQSTATAQRQGVYPNPAINTVRLAGDKNLLRDIKVYSITGQDYSTLVKKLAQTTDGVSLDVSSLAKGLYIIKTSSSTIKLQKL